MGKPHREAQVSISLSEKQKLVAHYYLADPDRNQGNAYRRVYDEKATPQGSRGANRLFTSPDFMTYLGILMDDLHKKVHVQEEDVLQEWTNIALLDIGDAFDPNGNILSIKKMPKHVRRSISSFDVEPDGTVKFKFCSKTDALNSLAKNFGMFKRIKEIRLKWMDNSSPLEMLERRKYLEDELIKRGLLPEPIQEKVVNPDG